jgi:exonuclease SbcC
LRHLTLQNVRSYEAAELELGPGVTVLAGDVGSGKTSLLHAVEMALFGFAEVEAPYLVRHRSGEASVTLTLADDEHTYELGRAFRRKTRRGREVFDPEEPTFRVDGALRRYSATEFRQRVIELVGFPDNPNPRSRSDLWRWAIYTPQERMREILNLEEADARLETIRKALGLERYRRAADNAEVVATGVRAEARSHTDIARGLQHFEDDLTHAEGALSTARVAQASAEADASEARRRRAELEELVESADRERRRLDALRIERDRLAAELPRRTAELAAARARGEAADRERTARRQELTVAEGVAERVDAARGALERAEAELRTHTAGLAALEKSARELAVAEEQLLGAQRATRAAGREATEAAAELARAEATLAEADGRRPGKEPTPPTPRTVEEIGRELVSLRSSERTQLEGWSAHKTEVGEVTALLALGVCPRCHQTVRPEEFRAHRQEAEGQFVAAGEALEATRGRLATAETERASRERFDRAHLAWTAREEARVAADAAVTRARERSADRHRALTALRSAEEALQAGTAEARARAAPRVEAERAIAAAEAAATTARTAWNQAERASAALSALRATVDGAEARWSTELERIDGARKARDDTATALEAAAASLVTDATAEVGYAQLLARRDLGRSQEIAAASTVTAVRERVGFAESRKLEAERGVAERREHVATAEHLQRAAAFLAGPFREALLDLERRRLGRAQAAFERSFARSFTALVEDPGLVARCSPSFVPYVEIDGTWTPAEALSGGERTALALAFRLALGDVVRSASPLRLDTIVLDEPTDGFSPEQVARMGELLRALPWKQVVVVTHEAALAAIADRTVRVRKVDGVSVLSGDGVPAEPPARTPRRGRAMSLPDAPPAT